MLLCLTYLTCSLALAAAPAPQTGLGALRAQALDDGTVLIQLEAVAAQPARERQVLILRPTRFFGGKPAVHVVGNSVRIVWPAARGEGAPLVPDEAVRLIIERDRTLLVRGANLDPFGARRNHGVIECPAGLLASERAQQAIRIP